VKPTDIAQLITLGPPALSPDGRTAAVATSRPDVTANEYRGRIWIAPVDAGAPPRPLTNGPRDAAPRFSPDGTQLAFLRTEPGGKPQLHVLPLAGGEPRRLTDLSGGAGAAAWSPDSRSIAFCARVPDDGRYGTDDKVGPEKEPPRRITGLQYRRDNVGFLADRREHVFLLDLDGNGDLDGAAEPMQLTDGDHDDSDVTWSPDGQWLAFTSARHHDREHDEIRDVFMMRADGTATRQLTDSSLALLAPAFTPDGTRVLAIGADHGPDRNRWVARNDGVFAFGTDGPSRPVRLTDAETVQVVSERLVLDGDRALVLVANRGAVDLLAVPLDGSEPRVLSAGRRQLTGVATAQGSTVVTFTDAGTAGELAVLQSGELVALTGFGAELHEAVSTVGLTEVSADAPDGYPVHGFLAVPDGPGPHPVLLLIHGGPYAQYGWALFDEAQVYAGAGYAVVYGNPRGSSGYGQAHGEAILGDVGERSAVDLYALLDAALERPDLDASRVGVLGGSHGGFMTSWLIGHGDRFRAAVSERAVNAIDSFTGSSDIGWNFARDLYGPDVEAQRRQSPLTYADAVSTPLLIIHSEQDWRCPLEQAQRLYVALRSRDATVELLLFPGEGHELSRSGLPQHRVARFEAIVDWFDRYLRG
jgi:dipeptidyl aminopeptidase/acylaminoacyl peptidase